MALKHFRGFMRDGDGHVFLFTPGVAFLYKPTKPFLSETGMSGDNTQPTSAQPTDTYSSCQKLGLPSGELTFCHGKSPFFMEKSTISMAIFHCYVSSPEATFDPGDISYIFGLHQLSGRSSQERETQRVDDHRETSSQVKLSDLHQTK